MRDEMERMRVVVVSQALLTTIVVTMAVTSAGCPRTGSPVDTSQAILVEAGAALAEVDRIVEPRVTTAGEAARDAVRAELAETAREREGCLQEAQEAGGDPGSCAVVPDGLDLYRARMRPWNELVAAMAATAGTLRAWQAANDAWRTSGERPRDWNVLVCQPVGTMVDTVLRLLVDLDLDVPAALRGVAGRTAELCNLGVMAAEALSASGSEEASP